MLETTDILALERRWKKYKSKIILRRTFITLFVLLIVFGGLFAFLNNDIKSIFNNTNETFLTKQTSSKTIKLHNDNISQQNEQKQQQTLVLQPINNKTKKIPQKDVSIPSKEVKVEKIKEETKPIIKVEQKQEAPKEIEKFVKNENIEKKETKEQQKISIQTDEVETTTYLQNKFYETHNIIFALMLAEEYLHQRSYQKALKWALTANEINPQNERSWVLFAKAKARSGHPTQAIKALQAFQKTQPSPQISTLIEKIKHGNYK